MKFCLLTNDVETTSIINNTLSYETGEKVLKEGMPLLLELYKKYNIQSTFFFTGNIAEKFPEIVKMVSETNHEIGSHGYYHEPEKAFDMLSYKQQVNHLDRSKKILEDLSGNEVISFRAPALRVNQYTPKALEKTGFLIDSSIASQRFDMFMSFGSLKKLNRLYAPRKSYFTSMNNLCRKGNSNILEIPISAFIMPYIGTTMRIFPNTTRLFRYLLKCESGYSGKPIVFLIHPNELIDEEKNTSGIKRRTRNLVSYFLADIVRYKLKIKNLGNEAYKLYNEQIEYFKKNDYSFISLKQYRKHFEEKVNG